MAPSVAVPVLAIVDEPLRADLALGALVRAAAHVRDVQPVAVQHRARDPLEVRQRELARAEMNDADAALDLVGRMLARTEGGAQARQQRLDVRLEQAGLQARQEVLHRQERADLLRAEPEARQLVARRPGRGLHEAVAALLPVPLDRCVHAIAHVLEVALERGARHAQLAEQVREPHRAPGLEQALDLVEAFGAVHRASSDGSLSLWAAGCGTAAGVEKTCHRTRYTAKPSATLSASSSQRAAGRSRGAPR